MSLMPNTKIDVTEADILDRLVRPGDGDMTPDAARAVLTLKFDRPTSKDISRLLKLNQSGKISVEERIVLERYLRIGQLIDLLHAKAHASLIAKHA
jgi:hypothetical protein